MCESVALHEIVFVIGLELILQPAKEKKSPCHLSLCLPSHNYETHKADWLPAEAASCIWRGCEISWRQNRALTRFNPPTPRHHLHQTDKTCQHVTNTAVLSIYNPCMYVSVSLQRQHPQCSMLGEMCCHCTVNNYSMHNWSWCNGGAGDKMGPVRGVHLGMTKYYMLHWCKLSVLQDCITRLTS